MKNLKKLSRENLKGINGAPGGCRSIAGAGPKTYLCYAPMY